MTTTKPPKKAIRKAKAQRRSQKRFSDNYPLRALARGKGYLHFDRTRKCFVLNRNVVMRGVCPFVTSITHVPGHTYAPLVFTGGGNGSGRGGTGRGIKIHNQIKRIIDRQYNPRIRVDVHAFVWPILNEIRRRNWILVDADVPVWWRDAHMATRVDFVCRAANGAYIIIELKTGYDGCYLQNRGPMQRLFGMLQLALTPHNEHLLQLFTTLLLFNNTFPDKATTEGYILQVPNDSGVHMYQLPPEWIQNYSNHLRMEMQTYRPR